MGSPFKMWSLDSAKSNMGTSGKLHVLLSKNEYFAAILYRHIESKRQSRSQFSLFGENQIFE